MNATCKVHETPDYQINKEDLVGYEYSDSIDLYAEDEE
jgi:hypothetical protein